MALKKKKVAKAAPATASKKAAAKSKTTPKKSKAPAGATPTPLEITVNEELLHYLKLEGSDHIFQIPGAAYMSMLAELAVRQDDFKSIVCKHETGAAFMADGFYRTTGRMGTVMVTSGPGATNALTGLMNANNDGSGLFLLTGEVPQAAFGLGWLQEGCDTSLDVDAVYTAGTSYSVIVQEPVEAGTLIKTAIRTAMSLPRRAVHISLPANVGSMPIPSTAALAKETSQYRVSRNRVSDYEVLPILIELSRAKRPLIFLGNGCRTFSARALKSLEEIVDYYGVPVMTTPDAKGIFPEDHPMSLRVFGCASCVWPYYWLNAPKGEPVFDYILVLGSSLGGLATMLYSPMLLPSNGEFYQVDVQQSKLGRCYPLRMGVVGEAASFVHGMRSMMGSKEHRTLHNASQAKRNKTAVAVIKKTYSPYTDPKQYASNTDPIAPAALMRCIQETLDKERETHIFVDAGNCVGWTNHYLVVKKPWNIYSALSMGPMGFAVGAVIGGKMGRPKSTCVAVTGDGAFLMHGNEISTARHYGTGAIYIVLNDNNLRMVSQGMTHFYPNIKAPVFDKLYQLGAPDLVKYSEGLGAKAYRVKTTAEAKKAIADAVKDADKNKIPQVIVVDIDFTPEPPYYNPLYAPPAAKPVRIG
ncbi:MAG: thiamine pyrophosphate-binding protein [Flavobacteriales bacterium]